MKVEYERILIGFDGESLYGSTGILRPCSAQDAPNRVADRLNSDMQRSEMSLLHKRYSLTKSNRKIESDRFEIPQKLFDSNYDLELD